MTLIETPRPAGNVPADVTTFVGRRSEVATVKRLLSSSRLVTITGVGGVGKTRLALRVAGELQRAFDAIWLIDLTSLQAPGLLAQTVATTVGLRNVSTRRPMAELTEFLADRRVLLVLDNCEHLLNACATLADTLLRAAPRLRVLATSRESLHVSGEHIVTLAPLSLPDPQGPPPPLSALGEYEAVDLFTKRAAAVLEEFVIDDDNRTAVTELCQQLDGIPLAIELAAARLRALSVDMIVEHLGERDRLLTQIGTAPPRHRSLHALIDWSFLLLSADERTLWARLSVFHGDFDLEAAETVCAGDGLAREDVLDLLAGLVDKSLLVRGESGGRVRYRMLETLRQYCQEKLTDPVVGTAIARRHRDHYRQLIERAEAEWFGPEQVPWFDRLRLEQHNLRTALDFCLTEPGEAETGLSMAAAMHKPYWLAMSYFTEGRRWIDDLLQVAGEPTLARARALSVDARLCLLQGDVEAAQTLLKESLELSGRFDDPESLADLAYLSGLVALSQGDNVSGVRLLDDAVRRHTAIDDLFGLAMSACKLAVALGEDTDRAVALCEEGIAKSEERQERWCWLYLLKVLAVGMWRRGELDRATSLARQGLAASRLFDDRVSTAMDIEILGWIACAEGDHVRSARLLGAAGGVARTVGAPVFRFEQHLEYQDLCRALLRDQMGEQKLNEVILLGTELSVREAVAEALGEPVGAAEEEPSPAEATSRHEASSPLTRREYEVAELIAKGMSNKEIAATLVVAQRTAEGHVEHILSKLNFRSRAQIAAWIIAGRQEER